MEERGNSTLWKGEIRKLSDNLILRRLSENVQMQGFRNPEE